MKEKRKENWILKFAHGVEVIGNRIPHPMYLFLAITLIFAIASAICAAAGVSVTYDVTAADGTVTAKTVAAVNMLSATNIVGTISSLWDNFKGISVLSLVIMLGLGIAVAEKTEFLPTLLRASVQRLPRFAVVYAVSFIGICANICADAGMILAPTLGAIVYLSIGRNPWIGAITCFSAAAAGFTANVIPAVIDALLSEVTQEAVIASGLNYTVHMLSNYIFTVVSTFVLAGVIAIISETFLVKFFGDTKIETAGRKAESVSLNPSEKTGLKWAGIAFGVLVIAIVASCIPQSSPFRNTDGGFLPTSPLMSSIVPLFVIVFIVLGVAYGIGAGQIKKASDVPNMMIKGVIDMAPTAMILFFVSIMLYVFNTSNMATIISVAGEHFLRNLGLTGFSLLVVFIILISIINMFTYSATAKWLILAPVFIPMFAHLGISPALTQLAYRIGDSCTNSITPLNPTLIIVVTILNKYRISSINKEEAGLGTVMSSVSVFCFGVLAAFIALLGIFMAFNIPIGIG